MSWETDADAAVESIRQNLGGWITPAYEAEIRASFVPSAAPAAASISPTVAPVTAPATLTAPDVSSDDDNSDDTSDSAPVFIPAPLPPPNNPPSLSLNAPAFVIAGQSFAVSISASDPNSDLNSMGIREQGSGLIGHWDISGGSSSASVAVTAPASGPLQFRGEVWDNAGNSAVGGWQIVQVTPAPKIQPPANDPPSVSVQAPASVTAGQSFAVSISASDPNAVLNSMGIREQGIGLIGHWDISGGSSSASVAVTAPASGPLQFRGEVWDNAGNSSAGPWQSVLVTVPALVVSLPVDNATPAAQSPIMPAGVAPSVSINAPSEVFPGDTFEVLAIASDPDGDLASMGIRWQGHGLIGSWDLTGVHATSSGRTAQITVPATGPILVRAEVHDLAGNGFTSDWVTINVASQPAPSAAGIDSWVRIDSVPTSTPGVSRL